MSRKLSQMKSSQFKSELSIAGSPDKLMGMQQRILAIMHEVNDKNAAELTNLEFLMRYLTAESRNWIRVYEQTTKQKIL